MLNISSMFRPDLKFISTFGYDIVIFNNKVYLLLSNV